MSIKTFFAERKSAAQQSAEDELTAKLTFGLQHVFGFADFRTDQLAVCQSVCSNKDTFVVMPTGGGKSLCYALPAIVSQGLTVVISPLISLIEDQVSAFLQLPRGGIPCAYLNSNTTTKQQDAITADLQRSERGLCPFLKLLYVTPERIVKVRRRPRHALVPFLCLALLPC